MAPVMGQRRLKTETGSTHLNSCETGVQLRVIRGKAGPDALHLLYVYECLASIQVCAPQVCLVSPQPLVCSHMPLGGGQEGRGPAVSC